MQKHKTKIIVAVVITIVLTAAFLYGGNAPALRKRTPSPAKTPAVADEALQTEEKTGIVSQTQTAPETETVEDSEKEASETQAPTDAAPPKTRPIQNRPRPRRQTSPGRTGKCRNYGKRTDLHIVGKV